MAKKNLKYSAEKIDELLTKADEQMATKSDLTKKVDKVDGKGLSTNDFTTAEKNKLIGIQEGAQKNTVTSVRGALQLNPQVGNVVISAADIGLGNANTRLTSLEDNVSEQSEEIAAVGAKVNTLQGTDTGKSVRTIAAEETAKIVGNAPANYDTLKEIADYISSDATSAAKLSNKVNKNTTDIAKVAEDLSATHQLASNAESAISEVVELTIPAIKSDVAIKATKSEAQGYATTAKNEANAYTDSEVEKLATVAPIAAGKIVKLTFGWTVSTLISFNATAGHTKDLFYYATYGTGTSARTKYNFLHQSGSLKIYIDESNTGTILYLHNTTQAGTMSVNNLVPSTVSIEEVSAIPENATLIGDEKTLATLTDMRTRLGKTEKAADSAKLGGIDADGYTRVLKDRTLTANNHLYIGTLPTSSGTTFDSLLIRGTIGGFGVIRRDFIDIAIGRRDGLQFGGLASFRHAGTSSYWDIAVNDAGEVYVLLYKQYCAYHIEVSSQQVTIDGVHGRTPTDTNWRYLSEELTPFDRLKADLFQTSPVSTSQPTRFAQLSANGLNIFGSTTSGWASGIECFDADSNSLGTIAGAYGSMSYTPSFFYYGGGYDNPIIKAHIGGAVEMKSTLTAKGDITAPNFTGGIRDTLPSTAHLRALVYTAGLKTATTEPTADNAYVGSSPDRTVLSVPVKDGTDTAHNVTNLRLPYNNSFFSDIATCPNSNKNIWYRNVKSGVAGTWKRFVLEDHNSEKWDISVASATKLATARKIWGQSFDGTGNVDGDITLGNNVNIYMIDASGESRSVMYYATSDILNIGYGSSKANHSTYINGQTLRFRVSSTNKIAMEILANGDVGIGTSSPTEKLDVAGNIKASGTMTATATYHSSDERLKTFECDVEVDLEKLKALPKKYFHWTADADGKRQLGTSAQAVEELFPELVSTNADGYKSVNYANLSIVALAAVDKLAEKNAELERRLAKIEKLLNIE